jgi:hypothetical protein
LFLSANPITLLLQEEVYIHIGDKWDEYGFTIDSPFKKDLASLHEGVDKRAILIVILHARKMNYGN